MPDDLPPSYVQAVTQVDPFALIAGDLPFDHLPDLIQVSRRFRRIFLPLLWRDPFTSFRRLGCDPYQDLNMLKKLAESISTFSYTLRETISVLDLRDFAIRDVSLSDSDEVAQFLATIVQWAPNLNSILVGPRTTFDLVPMFKSVVYLRLLDLNNLTTALPTNIFAHFDPHCLTYLSMNSVPGSKLNLPSIAGVSVLKLRNSGLVDSDVISLTTTLSTNQRIWSLDLSGNKIADGALMHIADCLFRDFAIRSSAFFFAEGRLINPSMKGHIGFGPFEVIQESRWSASFNHTDRYFADSPSYVLETNENAPIRNNGRDAPLDDSLEVLNRLLARPEGDMRQIPRSLTHLNLSYNNITSLGLDKLLRMSRGFLEVLSCSGVKFRATDASFGVWKSGVSIYGTCGAAHLIRPVYSCNLRELTVHHSLVTHIPTLKSPALENYQAVYIAEKVIFPRIQLMYPFGEFMPDMNPRLSTLTLTGVPRRSSGPLIKALTRFIDLLTLQEKAISDSTHSKGRRAPIMIRGLRHLRLEFEPDPLDSLVQATSALNLTSTISLDDTSSDAFSFFPGETAAASSSSSASGSSNAVPKKPAPRTPEAREAAKKVAREATRALRLGPLPTPSSTSTPSSSTAPPSKRGPEPQSHADRYVTFSSTWLGEDYTTKIWAGTAPSDAASAAAVPPAVRAYTTAVLNPALHKVPGPASPVQIRAGVPEGALVFHDAWEAAVVEDPKSLETELTAEQDKEARNMTDVVQALKEYRQRLGRRLKWTGKLAVVSAAAKDF